MPVHHQIVDDHQNALFSDHRYIYTYGYETARARPRIRPETVRGHQWGGGGAEECETEYDQLRQGSLDFEWGSFLYAPVRSGARAAGEAATGSHEVITAGLDGHPHDYDRYERHGQPSELFVARAARA